VGVWWVPIVLAAWFVVAVVAALGIGPVLRRGSEARKALDQQLRDLSDGHELSQDDRQASPESSSTGASDGKPPRARSESPQVPPPSDGTDPYTLKRNSTTSPSRMT
jgi:flagellar biosynthesis/type III secretory pathway M-ring protein FliF/YscJ